jgi:hypothetical protein
VSGRQVATRRSPGCVMWPLVITSRHDVTLFDDATRLFLFPHDPQSVLTAIYGLALVDIELGLNIGILNWALHRSDTPMVGGLCFTIRSLHFCMIAV